MSGGYLILFFLITFSSFFWFKIQSPKDNLWWLKTWTSHALLFALLAELLRFLRNKVDFLGIIAGSTLLFTGIGFEIIFSLYLIENKKMMFPKIISLVSVIGHLLLAYWGILYLSQKNNFGDVIIASIILFFYSLIITTVGIDKKFILYRESKVPEVLRLWLIRIGTIIILISLPYLTLFQK